MKTLLLSIFLFTNLCLFSQPAKNSKPANPKPAPAKTSTVQAAKPTTIKPAPPIPAEPKGTINLEKFSIDVSPALFFPFGSLKLSTKMGPAMQFFLRYNFNKNWALHFETGIYEMLRKRADQSAGHVIPYVLGVKWKSNGKLWAEAGAGIIRDQGTYGGNNPFLTSNKIFVIKRFSYRAGFGLQFNPKVALGLRWEGANINNQISLGLRFTIVNPENNAQ